MEIARNKRAYFDYDIQEKLEAGIELKGFEVKSVKAGRINLGGSYVIIRGDEAYLINTDIPPYQPKNAPEGYDPHRNRKLLLNASEIRYLLGKAQEIGLTLVPLRVYLKRNLIKLEIGLGRSRKAKDKRDLLKKRSDLREIREAKRR
ncbi:MAG: SsrA-binding protein SmpB [Patescibacteria group bacterium]